MAKGKKKSVKGSAGMNRNQSAAFLAQYETKPDVHHTGSGLMYRVIAEGEGRRPGPDDVVRLHQRIQLPDTTVVDDTYKKGLAESFAVSEAVEGLQEALQMMPVGGRYEFVVPPELAWGKKGNGGKVGPNAVMIMDIRLLEIES